MDFASSCLIATRMLEYNRRKKYPLTLYRSLATTADIVIKFLSKSCLEIFILGGSSLTVSVRPKSTWKWDFIWSKSVIIGFLTASCAVAVLETDKLFLFLRNFLEILKNFTMLEVVNVLKWVIEGKWVKERKRVNERKWVKEGKRVNERKWVKEGKWVKDGKWVEEGKVWCARGQHWKGFSVLLKLKVATSRPVWYYSNVDRVTKLFVSYF